MARTPSNQNVLPTNEILRKLHGFGYFGDKTWSAVRNLSLIHI